MGADAVRRRLQEGAPERIERHHFTPVIPAEIEPYIGTVRDRLGYPRAEFFGHLGPHFWYDSLYNDGPGLNTLWLGKTVVGEAGRIKSGLPNNGTFAVDRVGIASRMTVYDGLLHRREHDAAVGILSTDYAELVGTDRPSVKRLLAEMVFEMINPSQTSNETRYIDVVMAGARKHAQGLRGL